MFTSNSIVNFEQVNIHWVFVKFVIFSRQFNLESIWINPFFPDAPFLYLLKTSENLTG